MMKPSGGVLKKLFSPDKMAGSKKPASIKKHGIFGKGIFGKAIKK